MNRFRTLFVLAAALTFLQLSVSGTAVLASVQSDTEWERYTVKGEEFSIKFPELPAMVTNSRLEKNRERRNRVLAAYRNGVVYLVYTQDNSIRQSWDDFVQSSVFFQRAPTQVESQRNLTLNGFIGKELVVKTDRTHEILQVWQASKNFYVLKTVSVREQATNQTEFFSSLALGPKHLCREVSDGVGAELEDDLPVMEGSKPMIEAGTTEAEAIAFRGEDVPRKVIMVMKPAPAYTIEARKNQITGTVVLKTVFSAKGRVVNIRVLSTLPRGLRDNAITAARQIRFIPAQKDGKFVSMWMQLEYNFNLY